jgi:hypothetical protein
MPRGRSTRAKSTVVQLDFTDVAGRLPELDEVLLEVDEASLEDGERAQYIKWKFKVPDGEDHAGGVVYLNTSLSEQSLWALRSLLEALQVEIPAEAFDLDLKDMIGQQMMASIIHEEYEGRPQPRISDHWAVEEEAAKPEPAKATTRRGRAAPEPEEKTAPARSSRRAAKLSPKRRSRMSRKLKPLRLAVGLSPQRRSPRRPMAPLTQSLRRTSTT